MVRSSREQRRKDRKFEVLDNLGGQYEENFNDVKMVRGIIHMLNTEFNDIAGNPALDLYHGE
ncbi:hypothetical protein COLO4_36675 [Corchorus olitorius]|uniref:Uncharacterized protein n=1 Tax=Corchorus olitorius TaxID=93759 RepID=A0A1R3G6M0_9ROSI|nr:hypothetical protein COLO4_36675 [Corchorus olitorius]